jgi:flagellar hook-associated protein 3 FlgL
MRLATSTVQRMQLDAVVNGQAELVRKQSALASGNRITKPSDDPLGAAQAREAHSALAASGAFRSNQDTAKNRLGLAESTLGTVVDNLQSVRERLIQAGNGALSNSERKGIAAELRQRYTELIGLANADDGTGRALFGGLASDGKPFAQAAGGVIYSGDEAVEEVAVGPGSRMATSANGADVFLRVPTGTGVFTTGRAAGATGTAIADLGRVVDATQLTGNNYEIRFSVGGSTTYEIFDTTSNSSVAAGLPYQSGQAISFAGMSFNVNGAPNNGDAITVKSGETATMFDAISRAISALEAPQVNSTDAAAYSQALRNSTDMLDRGLERVADKRSELGERLSQLDRIGQHTDQRDLLQQAEIARVEDIDFAKAISEFTAQQNAVQAALQSYAQVARTNLLEYLR